MLLIIALYRHMYFNHVFACKKIYIYLGRRHVMQPLHRPKLKNFAVYRINRPFIRDCLLQSLSRFGVVYCYGNKASLEKLFGNWYCHNNFRHGKSWIKTRFLNKNNLGKDVLFCFVSNLLLVCWFSRFVIIAEDIGRCSPF